MKKPFVIIVFLVLFFFLAFLTFTKRSQLSQNVTKNERALGLKKIIDVPLSGGADRLDYQSINPENNRLYISHLGSGSVIVFDLKSNKIITTITNLGNPYGILVVPKLKTIYVSEGGNNRVAVISEDDLKVVEHISVGQTPDGLAYDPINNKIFVSDENGGTVSVIDASTNSFIENIQIGGSVGNTHYDTTSRLIYSISGNNNNFVEIDPKNNKVIQKYALKDCSYPHGFYIEERTHYALITCKGGNNMVVFDLNSKKIISKDNIGNNPDVLAYDSKLHNLYIAAESGVMTVFSVEKNKIKKLSQEFIASNAHTVAVDQETHQVYLPLENIGGKPVLRVLAPTR